MKSKWPIITLIFIFLLVGSFYFLNSSNSEPASESGSPITSQDIDNNNNSLVHDPDSPATSRYIEYTPEGFEAYKDKKRILYFYASWCPICRPVDAELKDREDEIPEDMVVIRVNYDDTETDEEEQKLANVYSITYQHTFVQIDSEGREIQKWQGGGLDEILERVN